MPLGASLTPGVMGTFHPFSQRLTLLLGAFWREGTPSILRFSSQVLEQLLVPGRCAMTFLRITRPEQDEKARPSLSCQYLCPQPDFLFHLSALSHFH